MRSASCITTIYFFTIILALIISSLKDHMPTRGKSIPSRSRFLSDLVKISFKDGHFLANNGKSLCTVPAPCMQELLSALRLVSYKSTDRSQQEGEHVKSDPASMRAKPHIEVIEGEEEANPIKVGQIFYLQFYFTGEFICYDHHNNKLILSRSQRTAFKIIEHIGKAAAGSRDHQTYDYIGNVVPNQPRYLIVLANQLLFLKFTDHNIYLGNCDEKSTISFAPSLFHIDRHTHSLLHSPCRMFSIELEKYVAFDLKSNEMLLKSQPVWLQGMCIIEAASFEISQAEFPTLPYHRKKARPRNQAEQQERVAVRVLQGSNRHYLLHHNSSPQKLALDIYRMIQPIQERLNATSTSFLKRYQPTFSLHRAETTFNLSNISTIGMTQPAIIEQEEREEIVEELTLEEVNFHNLSFKSKEEVTFQMELYPSSTNQYQIFLYDTMTPQQRGRRQAAKEKQLYLDCRQAVNGKQQCILKEYDPQKMRRESSKYKNILRVEFITREILTPYIPYYALLLNLDLYNYYRPAPSTSLRYSEERKIRLNLVEIQEILAEYYSAMQVARKTSKDQCMAIFGQLLDMGLMEILQQLVEAIIMKRRAQEKEETYSLGRERENAEGNYHFEQIEAVKVIADIVHIIARTMPEKTIAALLRSKQSLLLIRLCKFEHISLFFSGVQRICEEDPQGMLEKLEHTLKAIQSKPSASQCRNICVLWAYRLMRAHRLQSAVVEGLCQKLIQNFKSRLTQHSLIVLELILLSKGELFYSREVVKFLSFQRLQQEEIPFSLRDAYFSRIISSYAGTIQLPFRLKHPIDEAVFVTLERDNNRILKTYLEEVLPKNSKFQTVENKLFSLRFCQLFLYFSEGICQQIEIDSQQCKEYLPLLITILEEHLDDYPYQEEYKKSYILHVLKCFNLALQKHIRYIVYEQSQIGLEDDSLILRNCLEEYQKIILKKNKHTQSRRSNDLRPNLKKTESYRSNARYSKNRNRSSKRKEDYTRESQSRATRIIDFFSRKRLEERAEIIECIDKPLIWQNLNRRKARIRSEERLDLFEGVVNITSLLLAPTEQFSKELHRLISTPINMSSNFLEIITMILNKAYRYNLWRLIDRLSSSSFHDEEWRILAAIINKNHLVKYLVFYEEVDPSHRPSKEKLGGLFKILRTLLQHHLQWTKCRIDTSYLSTYRVRDHYTQVQSNYHHFQHDLEPEYLISLLAQTDSTYCNEELELHLVLLRALGAMTSMAIYQFYSNYILRYECQHYNLIGVRMILAFTATLTAPLRTEFANNFQYSLFKQCLQIKELLSILTGVKEDQVKITPQRTTNFNILTELADRPETFYELGEETTRQFLVNFFRMLGQMQRNCITHKEILQNLSYSLLSGIMGKYNEFVLLKYSVMSYILINIQRQMSYGLTKYLKSQYDGDEFLEVNEEEEVEEHASLIRFIKHSNYLLQRETQFFKVIDLSAEKPNVFLKYVETLLALVRIRDRIASYLSFQSNEKVFRSNSNSASSDSHTISRVISADNDSFTSSFRDDNNHRRQIIHIHNSGSVHQSQLENIEGINKLLCYEILESMQGMPQSQEIPPHVQELLLWLENHYKITLSSHSNIPNDPQPQQELIYQLDKTYFYDLPFGQDAGQAVGQALRKRNTFFETYRNTVENGQSEEPRVEVENINDFLSLRVENYLVLLIELLQRHIAVREEHYKQTLKSRQRLFRDYCWSDQEILHLLVLVECELNAEIRLYKIEDEQFKNRDYEVLPQVYYKISGLKIEEKAEQKYKQKCCHLEKEKLQVLLALLLSSQLMGKPLFVFYLHSILQRATYFNITNQANLQTLIASTFTPYYDLVYSIIQDFRNISPVVDDAFFVFKDLVHRDRLAWDKIYNPGEENSITENVANYERHINARRGMKGYHLVTLNYYMMVKMLLACSKTLNFDFKELFARPTIDKESLLSELIDVLSLIIRNSALLTYQKFEFLRVTIKLINTFLRGPIELNVQIAINKNYNRILFNLLTTLNSSSIQGEYFSAYLVNIKKLAAEGLFILIPFMELSPQQARLCEDEMKQSYMRSKKSYQGNYQGIISDYIDKRYGKNQALLYFDLALNFYYCLIQIYNQQGNNRIHQARLQQLNSRRREKRNRKNWMFFYQVYEVLKNMFSPIYRRLTRTYQDLTDGRNQEQLLQRAILFFTRHVNQVQVKVHGKIKKISFLLLKEASCYNVSIRKQFYRLIGRGQRELRLHKFMKISKYIIIRLQISKKVKHIIQNFKPLEVILINRQLWKSLCFLMALLLNILFIFHDSISQHDLNLYNDIWDAATAFTYTFIFFLYLIYFIEIFPLKLKISRILNSKAFRVKTLLIFVMDKTLGFALFYTIFLTLSNYKTGFISILLFDYFFRFKISSKITFVVFRSTFRLIYVIILLFTLLYISAILTIQQDEKLDKCKDVAGCTQDLFYIFMELRFNVNLPYTSGKFVEALTLIPRLFLKLVNISLLVGVIFMQKRKEEQKSQAKNLQIRDVCFICSGIRNSIEKMRNSNKGFYYHVELQHNLWNYIYYLIYLKNKERKNLNTIQSMIIEQWENNQIDWLPDRIL